MKKLFKTIASNWPVVVLLLFEGVLFWNNYTPGTWLTGWDSTQPELNFRAHAARLLTAVWQEYRGLGALDGMAHTANIVHLAYTWILSHLMQPNLIRYVFLMLMHAVGGMGVYKLILHLIHNKRYLTNQITALLGALFYLVNPATIQMFFTPLELFAIHFGFLPWLLLALIRFLESGKRKDALWFLILNVLAVSQAHVPTIFAVYAMASATVVLFHLMHRPRFFKRALVGIAVIFSVNAFWGLPYVYSAIQSAPVITSAKINRLSSPEIILRNRAYGDFKSVALMRGFSLDYGDWSEEGKFDFQMKSWREHLFSPRVETVGWVLFAIATLGLISVVKGRWKKGYPFVALFAIGFVTLGSQIPVISLLSDALNRYVPFYEEAFRFSFTKFSILYALAFSVLFSLGVRKIHSFVRLPWVAGVVSAGILVALFFLGLPAFKGQFFYEKLKVTIPQEYFSIFAYFNQEGRGGRIALLPQPSLFGWEFTRWGYRGSGFIWQGIANPTLHRAFDPWSSQSETYYNELVLAINGLSSERLLRVFAKYDVAFVLFDESVIAPGQGDKILKQSQTQQLLDQIGADLVWEEGVLKLYDVRNLVGQRGFVYAPQTFADAQGQTTYGKLDVLFAKHGTYLPVGNHTLIYPFADLMREEVNGITYTPTGDDAVKISVVREIPATTKESELVIPEIPLDSAISVPLRLQYQGSEILLAFNKPIDIKVDDQSIDLLGFPQLFVRTDQPYQEVRVELNGQVIELSQGGEASTVIPLLARQPFTVKVYDESQRRSLNLQSAFLESDFNQCWTREGADWKFESKKLGERWVLHTKDAAACTTLKLGQFGREMLVTVSLSHRSDTGARPHFCVIAEGGDYQCEHDDIFYASTTSTTWAEESRQITLSGDKTYIMDVVARPSDTAGEEWKIEYQTPKVEFIPLVTSVSFSPDVWKNFMGENRIALREGAKKISMEFVQEPMRTDVTKQGRIVLDNCDVFKRGWTQRSVSDKIVSYRTGQKGALCDFFEPSGISVEKSYLLRFVGENLQGRGLKVYVQNKATEHNDVEVLLSEGRFDQSFSLLAWPTIEDKGYLLTLESRSFGEETSENRLESVEFYQVPLNWLSQWFLKPTAEGFRRVLEVKESAPSDIENLVQITNLTKTGTHRYEFQVKVSSDPGVIVLSQGFEDGWRAYSVNSKFKLILPGIGDERLPHVKVNGWANGWLLPPGEHTVKIIFVPQYLGFTGLLLLAGMAFYAGVPARAINGFRKLLKTSYTTVTKASKNLERAKDRMKQAASKLWKIERNA